MKKPLSRGMARLVLIELVFSAVCLVLDQLIPYHTIGEYRGGGRAVLLQTEPSAPALRPAGQRGSLLDPEPPLPLTANVGSPCHGGGGGSGATAPAAAGRSSLTMCPMAGSRRLPAGKNKTEGSGRMALYAIGDLHLSLTANKSMEVFGPAWENYVDRIGASLSQLTADDVLVLAGDTSWGIDLSEAEADFRFLDQFPCKKYLVKGNHDYWWSTVSKMKSFFAEKGFTTPGFSPQQLRLLRGPRPLRHPRLVLRGGPEAPQRQGPEPGGGEAGDFAPGGGRAARLVLPPLPASVPGL